MTTNDKNGVASTDLPLAKRLLNSMWFYWLFLLGVSFAIAATIYLIWLRGTV